MPPHICRHISPGELLLQHAMYSSEENYFMAFPPQQIAWHLLEPQKLAIRKRVSWSVHDCFFLCPEISLYGVFSNEVLLSQKNNNSLYYFLGDMKIETILKFHIILLTMTITRNTITTNADMDVIKGEFFYTFCRSVKYCKQFGNQSGGL